MKKLLLGGALCTMLSTGAFAGELDKETAKKYRCLNAFNTERFFTWARLCSEKVLDKRKKITSIGS